MRDSTNPTPLPAGSRRRWTTVLAAASAAALALWLLTSVVVVDETELVIVERLGRIAAVYDRAEDRGLHVKLPWPVDVARRFDRRVQFFNPPAREVFTRDKKNVIVGAYVCWKIAEPPAESKSLEERPVVRFYRGLGSLDVAKTRLETRTRSALTTQVGQVELSRLLTAEGPESGPAPESGGGRLQQIAETVRADIAQPDDQDQSLEQRLGIEVVDLRINRLGFPGGNQQAIFERMRSERKKIADGYRSAGMAENKMIMSRADRQYHEILARAQADAERIRGEAEAESIAVLNRAHARDPEFYRITRTLEAYREILNERTTLVLSASSAWLKLLTEGVPEGGLAPPPASEAGPRDDVPARAEHPGETGESVDVPKTAAARTPLRPSGERADETSRGAAP